MRCPKCHYIGFDKANRCRNCGYDFSLSPELANEPDLPIRDQHASDGPLADFIIADVPPPRRARPDRSAREAVDFDRESIPAPIASRDLPLFQAAHNSPADDAPLVTPRAVPRPPLAVRRATPDPVRLRTPMARPRVEEPVLQLEPSLSMDDDFEIRDEITASEVVDAPVRAPSIVPRVIAGLVDLTLIAAIDAAVIHFTLQVTALTVDEIGVLPLAPLLGFFALLNGGYFFAFTAAGGQTIGKMLAGIRVTARDGGRVTLGHAAIRTAAYLLSALPAGLGFAAALFGGLALHDRIASTQVVPTARPTE